MKKQMSKIYFLLLSGVLCIVSACKARKTLEVLDLFPEPVPLTQKMDFYIHEDSLAVIEGLASDGDNLIVYDFHSGYNYTLFDGKTGEYIARFGRIGQGPGEIPRPCLGYLSERHFSVFDDQTRIVLQYSLDSLREGKANGSPVYLTKYDIPDAEFSRLIPISDSHFVAAGLYKSHQYVLFDKNNQLLDSAIDVYNAADSAFNTYTRYHSNQGDLVMHPAKNLFAYSVNFSSNIDFFEIQNNKIKLIKSLRLANPVFEPEVSSGGGFISYSANLTPNTQIGYIHLSATDKYVYTLYSDKKVSENWLKSTTVLVFDWAGNPVKRYELNKEAYYIAVDETQQHMLAAVKNDQEGWSILRYAL